MVRIDPVMPPSLDGLGAERQLLGRTVRVLYRVGRAGSGPTGVIVNGEALPFTREANPYRTGGVEVATAELSRRLTSGANDLVVNLG